jgi:very-short-patch-repair endonuclease
MTEDARSVICLGGEAAIMEWLKKESIVFNHQHRFDDCVGRGRTPLKFDFYVPEKRMCIEFDGEQHFRYRVGMKVGKHTFTAEDIESIKRRDGIKEEYCSRNGIRLIRIPYTKIKSIDKVLEEEIYGKTSKV